MHGVVSLFVAFTKLYVSMFVSVSVARALAIPLFSSLQPLNPLFISASPIDISSHSSSLIQCLYSFIFFICSNISSFFSVPITLLVISTISLALSSSGVFLILFLLFIFSVMLFLIASLFCLINLFVMFIHFWMAFVVFASKLTRVPILPLE